jgi:hypothetical protein
LIHLELINEGRSVIEKHPTNDERQANEEEDDEEDLDNEDEGCLVDEDEH